MHRLSSIPSVHRWLVTAGAAIWIVAALNPADPATWALENVLLVVGVAWIVLTYNQWPLSTPSYILIFVFFVMHVLGAHYTYSDTPAGEWARRLMDSERNHYDRIVHFFFGLLIVSPFRDQIERATPVNRRTAWGASIIVITALSTVY